jgi:Ca2+-binding EF-hand superfamily protein
VKIRESLLAAGVAASMMLSGSVFAQSGALTQPNNSAGTPLDRAPQIETRGSLPSRTQSADAAFVMLDAQGRGYVTRSEMARLPTAMPFDAADRNRDGVLNLDEFERVWNDQDQRGQ